MRTPLVALVAAGVALTSRADPPQLESVWPPGGQRGTTVSLALEGQFEQWPCQVHFSAEGFRFSPDPKEAGKGTLEIPDAAPLGAVLIRAGNEEGLTAPLFFVIDQQDERVDEDEDKNSLAEAATLDPKDLPLIINGRLPGHHELDAWRLELAKGQTLHAAVEGYALRSLIDPVLHLYDREGRRLALSHDSATNLDPRLRFTAPKDGPYTLAVTAFAHPPASSVSYRGEKKAVYRLYLGLQESDLPERLFPLPSQPDTATQTLELEKPIFATLEPGKADHYTLAASKGDPLLVRVEGYALGYKTDPVLSVYQPDGKLLKTIDDTNKLPDPEHYWRTAAEGEYRIEVADRFQRGGEKFRYRLSATKALPAFSATLDSTEFVLEADQTIELKVKVTRLHGHKDPLEFAIPGLPKSVTLTPPEKVSEKTGDVVLKLQAAKDAPPFQQSLQLWVSDLPEASGEAAGPVRPPTKQAAMFSFKDPNWRGPYIAESTDHFWLTIPPIKPDPSEKEPDEEKQEASKRP